MRQFYNISVTATGAAVSADFRAAAAGRITVKSAAFALPAFDLQPALMAIDDVLDDGQAQPGAAFFPAAFDVHPVESLGQAGHGAGGDALAVIAHRDENLAIGTRPS